MATVAIDSRAARPPGFWASTNGKKAVMAVTGVVLFLFVLFHMVGNLQVFDSPEQLNFYGMALRRFPEALWGARAVMLTCVVLHILTSVQLALRKSEARPIGYSKRDNVASDYASRTMYWSGPIVLAFIIFHLLHFTAGIIHPGATYQEGKIYENVVSGFQVWYVSAWYVFAVILLGFHIRHGAWSMFQSLGLNHPRHTPILKNIAGLLAVVIVLGYCAIPISILLGLVK